MKLSVATVDKVEHSERYTEATNQLEMANFDQPR